MINRNRFVDYLAIGLLIAVIVIGAAAAYQQGFPYE